MENRLLNRSYICILINVVCINLGFNMLSTVVTPYALTLGTTLTTAGVAAGVMSIVAMCSRPVTGIVSDAFDTRRLLFLSSLLIVIVILTYSVVDNVTVLIMLRVIHGLLFGLSSTVMMAATRDCIPQGKLGEGMGYYGASQAVASVIGPNLGLTLSQTAGYTVTFTVAAALTLSACAVSLFFKPERTERKSTGGKRLALKSIIAPEVFPYLAVCFILGSAGSLDSNFLSLYAAENGIASIGWYFTLQALVLIVAKFILGKASDRLSFPVILVTGSALMGGALVSLALLRASGGILLLSCAAVLRAVGTGLLQPSVQAECFKAVAPERSGAASATYLIGMDFGVGTAPVIGALIEEKAGYRGMYTGYLIPLVLASAVYFIYRNVVKGKRENP